MRTSIGQDLYERAKELIPGGTQLLSKRPEMFLPNQWPAYYATAIGCDITDLDGKTYHDFSIMGVGSCILGYADPDVTAAVMSAVQSGNMSTLNAPEEVELAELLIHLHPWADMVRYARTGGEAMAIAVRLARASSQKDVVLFSGYHGWSDWYLSANLSDDEALTGHLLPGLEPLGVPRSLRETAVPFRFNDVAAFKELAERYADRIGAIVVEPIRNEAPTQEFQNAVHSVSSKNSAPLVIDEITAGFRLNAGGAHLLLGWNPDIAVFAKGMSNGHPMAAVVGKRSIMEVAQKTFVSSTYWTDRTGPAAAIATIKKMVEIDTPRRLAEVGTKVQAGWQHMAEFHRMPVKVGGILPLSHIDFLVPEPLLVRTGFTQGMLERGFLATGAVYASVAHTDRLIEEYLAACGEVFGELSDAIANEKIAGYLRGPKAHSGFRRLN